MNVCYLWSAKAVSDKMKQLINSSDLRYHAILGVSCYIEEAYSYFVLCYLTYLSVVAFNGVGGVYRLRIAGVYWKCSVRRSQLSHHDFMTMGYVSPHLASISRIQDQAFVNAMTWFQAVLCLWWNWWFLQIVWYQIQAQNYLLISRVLVPKAYMFIIWFAISSARNVSRLLTVWGSKEPSRSRGVSTVISL